MPSRAHQPSSAASAAAFSSAGITSVSPQIWCSAFRVKTPEPPSFVTSHWAKTSASRNAGGAGLSSTSNVPQPAFRASQHNSTPCNPPPTIVTRIRPPPSRNFPSRDHTRFLFPVGLGLGAVPAHAYVISAAPTFRACAGAISRRSLSPKKSVYRSSPRLRCSTHARYSPGKAGSSPSSPSCLTTAATLLR